MLEYLYNALRAPYGIILECDDIKQLRIRLYKERLAAQDPQLKVLSLIPSPMNPQHLWIVKREEPEDD